MTRTFLATLLTMMFFVSSASAQVSIPEKAEDAPLATLAGFAGKTWVSESADGSFKDVSSWKWIVEGQVMFNEHWVNGGEYGGATLIHFDHAAGQIIARYATSAKFYTDSVLTLTEDGYTVKEAVKGTEGGITNVEAGVKMISDDEMVVWSRYQTADGEWSKKDSRTYRPEK